MAEIRVESRWKRVLGNRSLPFLVQWAIRRGFRVATARMRTLPDFVIIGAQRCGTTSLYNYLIEHPAVSPAFMKETHFFDFSFHKGVNWYRAFFPCAYGFSAVPGERCSQKRGSRPGAGVKPKRGRQAFVTGESTPYYLFHPRVPERVKQTVPEVKLIVLLRNPVDRAYSHYHHELRTGAEQSPFEDALKRENEVLPREAAKILEDASYRSFSHVHHSYLSRGIYVDQLRRWIELFGRESMIIVRSEDFCDDPATTVDQVFRFLGLPSWTTDRYKKYNLAHYEPLDAATRERLIAYYEPHNRRLYEYLGLDMGWEN